MCLGGGGGGGNTPAQEARTRDPFEDENEGGMTKGQGGARAAGGPGGRSKNRDNLKAGSGYKEGDGYSYGTVGSGGFSTSGKGSRGSYWKSNPDYDQIWLDKGYKVGDKYDTRQSNKHFGS